MLFRKPISAIILSGGKSIRMGRDKNELIYQGKTLLNYQIDKMKKLRIKDILVSGYKGENCKEKIVEDEDESRGPLSGISTCLKYIKYDRALVISVDCPLVSIKCFKELIAYSYKKENDICLISHNGKIEPLIAIYKKSTLLEISNILKSENHCVMALVDRLKIVEYKSDDDIMFSNINFKSDYEKLLRVNN